MIIALSRPHTRAHIRQPSPITRWLHGCPLRPSRYGSVLPLRPSQKAEARFRNSLCLMGVSTTFTRPTAPVSIAIVQTKDLPWPTRPFRLTGPDSQRSQTSRSRPPVRCSRPPLRGRLSTAPTLVDLTFPNTFGPSCRASLGRVPTAPIFTGIESNLDLGTNTTLEGERPRPLLADTCAYQRPHAVQGSMSPVCDCSTTARSFILLTLSSVGATRWLC